MRRTFANFLTLLTPDVIISAENASDILAGDDCLSRCSMLRKAFLFEGDAPTGFQTPALAYGADFVLECPGVTREDVT